jgi:hypothetical protein
VYLKTTRAAEHLCLKAKTLLALIRHRRILAPEKDSSGDYVWSPRDLARARAALRIDRRRRAWKGVAYAR